MSDAGMCISDGCESASCSFLDWLATELAPTILGNKPATVLSFVDCTYQATLANWRQYGCKAIENTLIQFLTLRNRPNLETVLFYRADALKRCIMDEHHKCFLVELGYPVDESLDECLALLCERFRHKCPHEVGVLLGIPLKDVLGFMDKTDLQLTCRREWCVYGNPDASLAAMEKFASDKALVSCMIERGVKPYEIMCGKLDVLDNIA